MKIIRNNKFNLLITLIGTFTFSFLLTFIAGSLIIRPQTGNAVTGLGLVGASSMTLTTVYYGAKADMSLAAGTYSNTVRYTATANISTIPTPGIVSVSPTSGTTAGGTAIQIVGTGITVSDQSITTAVTIDGTSCENVSISSNTPITGQDTIYCTTPAHAAGAVDVAVAT